METGQVFLKGSRQRLHVLREARLQIFAERQFTVSGVKEPWTRLLGGSMSTLNELRPAFVEPKARVDKGRRLL